ncbi:MAG: hypothetical protein KIS94_05065 [Chitinophagales bacterium]|nr:hypothetical protein [Chitinophagales bacterium]
MAQQAVKSKGGKKPATNAKAQYPEEVVFNGKALPKDLTKVEKEIIDSLLREALASGIVTGHEVKGYSVPAGEGSETELVALTSADIRYAVKIDMNEKLVREALKLKSIANRRELPKGFANHFPQVYAIKNDKPPFAYIMQAFERKSFAEYLFKEENTEVEMKKVMKAVLDALLPSYKSTINYNLVPSIKELYVKRIHERLNTARNLNAEFKKISTRPITINGNRYDTPETYLHHIEHHLHQFGVHFTTFVHGDCHMENILLKFYPSGKVDIKFIDTKDWHEGDYMFDICKFMHYLQVTGPAQKTWKPTVAKIDFTGHSINYTLHEDPFHIKPLSTILLNRVKKFAGEVKDVHWHKRYSLSMASNLLGLPAARLKSNDPRKINAAYILYAEGLKHLSRCCS